MTNDFHENEFENTELEHVGDEPQQLQKTGIRQNLSDAWRTRPMFKLLVLMVAVGALVAASVSFFAGHKNDTEVSKIVNPPQMHEAPGGTSSPFVQQQTRLANEERAQEALEKNGSALPTPLGQNSDVGDLLNRSKNDPLNELRAQVQQLQKQQVQQQQTQQQIQQVQQVQQPQKPPEQFDDSLAQSMQRQMQALMENWTPKGVKQIAVSKLEDVKNEKAAAGVAEGSQQPAAQQYPPAKIVVQAGTVSYGQLLTEANSDVPGPILAQIVSGPLAGARIVGSFQVTNNASDYLVLSFSLASLKGKEYQVSAIALDPSTTLGGMATEVDQRYFTRVILPAAAGFLQGFGQALGQNSITTTTNGQFAITEQAKAGVQQGLLYGLGQSANTASQFFQNQANQVKPLVRVAAGTPIGIFFINSVKDNSNQPPGYGQNGNGQYANGQYGNGQYGNGINGFGNGQNPYGANGVNGLTLNPYGNQQNPYGAQNGAIYGANTNGGYYPGSTVSGYGGQSNNPYSAYGTSGYNGSTLNNPNSTLNVLPGVGSYGYR